MKLCDYGCGQKATYQFKNGKWCCSKFLAQCPMIRKKNRKGNKEKFKKGEHPNYGKIPWNKGLTKEVDKRVLINSINVSKSLKGKIPWNKNLKNWMSKESNQNRKNKLKGKPGPNKGKKFTEASKKKMSKAHIGQSGPLAGNWQGGISCGPYCDSWTDVEYKKSIMKRDGYKCLNPECNKKTKKLCLHHINYNKKDCSPYNLITVCISCNAKANGNRKWHKSWYKAIIYRRYKIEKHVTRKS